MAPVTQESSAELGRASTSPESAGGSADPGFEGTPALKGVGAEAALERRLCLPRGAGVDGRLDTSLRV